MSGLGASPTPPSRGPRTAALLIARLNSQSAKEQRARLRAYCHAQQIRVIAIYRERTDRGWKALLRDAERREFQAVIIAGIATLMPLPTRGEDGSASQRLGIEAASEKIRRLESVGCELLTPDPLQNAQIALLRKPEMARILDLLFAYNSAARNGVRALMRAWSNWPGAKKPILGPDDLAAWERTLTPWVMEEAERALSPEREQRREQSLQAKTFGRRRKLDIQAARGLRAAGRTYREIAAAMGLPTMNVYRALTGKNARRRCAHVPNGSAALGPGSSGPAGLARSGVDGEK
jgi:hypothetical protein